MTWGLPPPDASQVHWGARVIYTTSPHGYLDIVWNRQEMVGGTPEERQALADWVNNRGLPWLHSFVRHSENAPSTSDEYLIAREGDGYRIEANPRQSYGYMYIVAYPYAPATEAFPGPIKPPRKSCTRRSGCRRLARDRW